MPHNCHDYWPEECPMFSHIATPPDPQAERLERFVAWIKRQPEETLWELRETLPEPYRTALTDELIANMPF
jgi:hypothetical protein